MKIHTCKLAGEPFSAIQTGTKVIESQLYDSKRQAIELGDTIVFTNRDDPRHTLSATVLGLLRYPSFAALFSDNEPEKFGGPSVEWLLEQVNEFYSESEQQEYGVLGIRLQLV